MRRVCEELSEELRMDSPPSREGVISPSQSAGEVREDLARPRKAER
jgi:hypothetical protein